MKVCVCVCVAREHSQPSTSQHGGFNPFTGGGVLPELTSELRFCPAQPVRTGNSQVRTRGSTHTRGHLPDAGLGGTCRLAHRGESGTFSRLPGIPATARGFSTSPQIRGPEEGSQSREVKMQIPTAGWIRSSALSLCLHTHTHTQRENGSQLRKSRRNAPTEVARG